MACSRAVMNRNAKGNERHPSNSTTVSREVLTCRSMPNGDTGEAELRNAIGSFQPSSVVP